MVRKGAIALVTAHVVLAATAKLDKRIVNGDAAKAGDIPSLVSLQFRNRHHDCGGALLDSTTVLTAGHCIDDTIYSVRAGSANRTKGGFNSEIIWRIRHPAYTKSDGSQVYYANDIGIYKLKTPIKESETIKYAKLPANGSDAVVDSMALVAGWGTTSGKPSDTLPEELRKIQVPVISRQECRKASKDVGDRDTIICANGTGKSVCKHDSGGPLVDAKTGQLIGISSWVIIGAISDGGPVKHNDVACGTGPNIFTRVDSYLDFIHKYLEPFEPPPPEPTEPEEPVDYSSWRQMFEKELALYGRCRGNDQEACRRAALRCTGQQRDRDYSQMKDFLECVDRMQVCEGYAELDVCVEQAKKCNSELGLEPGDLTGLAECATKGLQKTKTPAGNGVDGDQGWS